MSNKYSYSKLDTYKSCPFKFYLQYELGNYSYSSNISVELGSAVHKAEETIATAISNEQTIDYVKIKNNFLLETVNIEKKYPKEFLVDDGKSGRSCKQKVYEYLNNGIYKLEKFMLEHPEYRIVGIEKKFSFDYDSQYTFSGAIDRVFFDTTTNKYIIQDIKTYAVPMDQKDLVTPLQFVIYTLAASQIWNCNLEQINCQYYLPFVDGLVQIGGTNGYLKRGTTRINQLLSGINENDFKPNPTPLCNWCSFCRTNPDAKDEFKLLCPYYSLWERNTRNKFDIGKHENEWSSLEDYPKVLLEHKSKFAV